jgi:LPS sulfotransferase NodH
MRARKFCILTTARCGSNALVSLLRMAPDTICHGELFNKSGIWTAPQPNLDLPHSVADRDRDPVGFLRDIARETFKHAATFGFKLFMAHGPVVRTHVMSSGEYRMILLSRTNRLAQYSSFAIAQASGIWHTRKAPSGDTGATITFDRAAFGAYMERIDRAMANARAQIEKHGPPCFALEYRDIKSERALDALSDFLGMDRKGPLSGLVDSIPHVKRSPSVIIDRFSNPDDVVAAMRDLGHEEWLKDESEPLHV